MKLELKHLAPYLPYGLKVSNNTYPDDVNLVTGLRDETYFIERNSKYAYGDIENCKPILRPLSDYADINSDAMNSLNCDMSEQINLNEFAIGYICLGSLYQSTYDLCLKNHIDVFGLIDQGLALPLI
jgi:hypothetical protein